MRCSLRAGSTLFLAVITLAATNLGCASAPPVAPADLAARAVASAGAQLKGSWTLQSFRPETSLEPMLQAMLDFQYGRLKAVFDGQRMVADSVGIHVDRAYQISEVQGDEFKLTSFDAQGVPYEAICSFLDGKLQVHSTTDPWRGYALLTRTVPALPAMPVR
ncbi:MAG: hypothetical protein ABJE95_32430 [Byssovorax sp.]